MRTVLLAAALAAALAACASAPAAPEGPVDPERLYHAKCTRCHRAYEPASRTQAVWQSTLRRMSAKAHLTPEQDAALREWVLARAADAGGAR